MTDRIYVTFPPETKQWLESNYRLRNHPTVSKFVVAIVVGYMQSETKKQQSEPQRDQPKTPEEEYDSISEEMGLLEEKWHEKIQAIKSILPEDIGKPDSDEKIRKDMKRIWGEITKKKCYIMDDKGKGIVITRSDLAQFEHIVRLKMRRKQLEQIQALNTSAVSS